MQRHGSRYITVLMPWGKTRLRVVRWRCAKDQLVCTEYPSGMDRSGFSPEVLKRCIDLCTRLPYREAQQALKIQGICLNVSQCERLGQSYGTALQAYTEEWVKEQLAGEGVCAQTSDTETETYVLQVDGVMVMEKDKPVEGKCEGREVKQALLHPLGDSSDKDHFAQACSSDKFTEPVQALLNYRSVEPDNFLIGIADGATWIDNLFDKLKVDCRVLDVYHATEYLETVMKELGYDEVQRKAQRASWCRGDIDARYWLKHHIPEETDISTWSTPALQALRYLRKRIDQMDYHSFKQKGFPIGSGAVEGANKSVIGARMKRAGMRWSKHGVNRMATMRSLQTTANPWVDFHDVRIRAFNH